MNNDRIQEILDLMEEARLDKIFDIRYKWALL